MKVTAISATIILAAAFAVPFIISAQSAADLQNQINEHSTQIDALNKEIAEYEAQLKTTQQAKNTLQNKVNQLDLQRKKLTASISVTKNQIGTTQLQIQQLSKGIANREVSIDSNRGGVMGALRRLSGAGVHPIALGV